jgi:ABC-type amino acid transport substrate-binding protein
MAHSVATKENVFSYHAISDLYNKRIGKGAAVYINEEFDRARKDNRIIVEELNDTDMGNLKKLIYGRLDVVIGVVETMRFYASKLGYETRIVTVNNLIDANRPGYLVLSKKSEHAADPEMTARLTTTIKKIMTDGTYQKIKERYVSYF